MLAYDLINSKYVEKINGFLCSDEPSIEHFLKHDALRLHQNKFAVTRLYFDENENLIGFFTLFNDHVQIVKKKKVKHGWLQLEKGTDYYPGVLLHYVGIDTRYRAKGYGTYLILEVLEVCHELQQISGCNFICLEALPGSIGFYEKTGLGFTQMDTKYATVHLQRIQLTDMLLKLQ
ncbi:GNAT family N-acetyltransferase [Brevibacillus dissolubilis]|uniref:GNAT family N-acetyltransferase n=1 Tax=Brevibacillus dissolubilis TaxID=1844116 RepID=UPI001115FC1B|nr:GNAT family N-acetyltransferase [Brevibacillus dissolubilis]